MSVTLKKITVRQIVIIGLMAALCLVSNYFSIPIPIGIDKSPYPFGKCFLHPFGLYAGGRSAAALLRESARFSMIFLPGTAQNALSPLSTSF